MSDEDEPTEADDVALQVLCRVFDDGADIAMDEWRAWYKPDQWLWYARALGAFISQRLRAKRELTPNERESVAELEAAMQRASGGPMVDGIVPVTISMGAANGILHAIATPVQSAASRGSDR